MKALSENNRDSNRNATPNVSIITVSYNRAGEIERTILNVLNQSYLSKEFIIIDGGSTDETVKILEKYRAQIDIVVSEPDQGIYDAMNKGIALAKGEWVNFMNCGDYFYSDTVLEEIFAKMSGEADIVYGDHHVRFPPPRKEKTVRAGCDLLLHKGSQFCHQSAFIKTSLHQKNLYDTNIPIASDFDFFLKMVLNGAKFLHVPVVVASIAPSGLSDRNQIAVIRAWKDIVLRSGCKKNRYLLRFHFAFLLCTTYLKQSAKALLIKLNLLPG